MKVTSKLKEKLISSLAFLIPFISYTLTAFPTIPNEDGGELITASFHLGIAHPPGYPLLSIVGNLFTKLIPFGNIPWRMNISSAFFSALTVWLIYTLLKKIYQNSSNTESKASHLLIPLIPAFSLGFSDIFWSQAIRFESYSLNSLLTVLVLYLTYLWHLNPTKHSILYLIGFIVGIGAGNHQTLLITAPAIFLFVVFKNYKNLFNPKLWLIGALSLIVGLSIYLYLPIRSAANPALDYNNPETTESFIRHITRATYSESSDIDSALNPSVNEHNNSPKDSFSKNIQKSYIGNKIYRVTSLITLFIKNILSELWYLFGLIGLFSLALPLQKKWRQKHPFSIILPIFTVIYIAAFYGRLQLSDPAGNRPFYIMPTVATAIASIYFFLWIKSKISNKTYKIVTTLLALLITIPLLINFQNNNQSKNYLAYDIAKATLHFLPENATLFVTGNDDHIHSIMYLQEVENFRKDVFIYNAVFSRLDKYPNWPGWDEAHKSHSPIFAQTYNEAPINFTYAPHTPFSVEMVPNSEYNREKTRQQQKEIIPLFDQIPCRGEDQDNLDENLQDLAGYCHFQKATALLHIDNQAAEQEFINAIFKNSKSIQENQNIYPYYYAAHIYNYEKFYEQAIPFLEAALQIQQDPAIEQYLLHIQNKIQLF